MLIRRINPWFPGDFMSAFDEFDRLRRQLEALTGGITRGLAEERMAGVFPLVNVTEDKDNYYVRAELPGLRADDLEISVTADSLSISGERKLPVEEANAKYHRREREAGRFSRIITLPSKIDTDKVEAKCTNGILTVILPKAEDTKPKQITVKTS